MMEKKELKLIKKEEKWMKKWKKSSINTGNKNLLSKKKIELKLSNLKR